MTALPCVYATSGWGIHDIRWTKALRRVGFDPTIIRLGVDALTAEDLRDQVTACAHSDSGDIPVLAGPLDSVTVHLVGLDAPIIGLSWGFDLHTMHDRSWLPSVRGLIVDSDATAQLATEAGVDPRAITYLPWGIDTQLFSPDGPQADLGTWGVPEDARTVLSLRAHEPLYRVRDVIEGFAQASTKISDLHLLIGHSGSLTETLLTQARELGIEDRTHFIGSLPEEDLPALLRATDIYVSASEVDGTSVTLLQAMACRTPVLTSDTAGNRSWVEEKVTGYLFRTGDCTGLGQQLSELLTAPTDQINVMTSQARSRVEHQANWGQNLERLRHAMTGPEF